MPFKQIPFEKKGFEFKDDNIFGPYLSNSIQFDA